MSTGPQRWPPVVAVVIGFLMVFVALPNPLKIPNQNPGATAELAPVPGNEESTQTGNFGETGLATSDTLGSDAAAPQLPPLPPGQEVPVDKECVGDPPRQTEDPLSPPCVPYFSGKNGGATWQGVTGEQITVVFYNDLGVEADLNQPYKAEDDAEGQTDFQTVNLVRTMKAHLRYFQSKFQTYGRLVRAVATSGSVGSDAGTRRRHALRDAFKYKPFAVIYLGNNAGNYFAQMAEFEIPSFGLNEDVGTEFYDQHAPYIWSFYPDQLTETAWSASFICRRLLGRGEGDRSGTLPAKYPPDPNLKGKPRKIGFIYQQASQRGPELEQMAELLMAELKRQCGYEFDEVYPFKGAAGAGGRDSPLIMSRFKQEHITTVICYCVPVPNELTVQTMFRAASAASYFPEWYWDHMSRMDKPIWQQTYGGGREHFSFGTSYYWRQPAFRAQQHYKAYQEATKDGSTPNVRWNFNVYYLYLNLFTAIQAAGAEKLTPETVERGMFTFRFLRPSYPWLPTGEYGPGGPSPYTFVDTGQAWWWDPTGKPPGGKDGEGCKRVIEDGARYYAGTWPIGDAGLNEADAPCSEDQQRIVDPQPGDF